MIDMKSRQVIEAMRSGVPSRLVGRYFSEARPAVMNSMRSKLDRLKTEETSEGMVILGKYGEGKTHLLNSVFSMAHENNMVVSWLSLSKETPMQNLPLIYQKLISNTYLPSREEPGFLQQLEGKLPDSAFTSKLLLTASSELQCNKLWYVIKALAREQDDDMKFRLESDLEGDFMTLADLKKEYRKLYHETAKFNQTFKKTLHCMDYINFMSVLFQEMGYNGWVILFDEAELVGRMAKKSRMKAYQTMANFLFPTASMHSVLSIFAFTSSYLDDVIEGKNDYTAAEETYPDYAEITKSVLDKIMKARELAPLTESEMKVVAEKIITFHEKAYDWKMEYDSQKIIKNTIASGTLLRTKLRTEIEMLDQLYQYGDLNNIASGTVDEEKYEELTAFS